MNYCYLIATLLVIYTEVRAQDSKPDSDSQELDEICVSATKFAQPRTKTALLVQSILRDALERQSATNTADLLQNSGLVFVQKSQLGGGSPVIRGFEANRVLLVVDGIRMNNAIYRGGHLQNVITLGSGMLEKVEILNGSGGLIYGSDALGGVLSFQTIQPKLSAEKPFETHASIAARYGSANQEKTLQLNWNMGWKKWATHTSLNFSDFGDLRAGARYFRDYPDFGKRPFYVQRLNGQDSIFGNSRPNMQVGSGYKQLDLMQKVLYRHNEHWTSVLNLQYSTSTDVPRYDRLTETSNGAPRFADWRYGPQKRFLAALHNEFHLSGFLDQARVVASYQKIDEDRINRRFNNINERHQEENVQVLGLTADGKKAIGDKQLLQLGLDAQLNFVQSLAYSVRLTDQTRSDFTTRYPNGGNAMHYLGAYALYQHDIHPLLRLHGGMRYNRVWLEARLRESAFPFSNIRLNSGAWCGNLGAVLHANGWQASFNANNGFRAPNIDDIAKIFESSPGNVIVPNPELRPEYTYNLDFGIAKHFKNKSFVRINAYQTWINQVIVTKNGQYNGQDSIVYDGVLSQVQLLTNSNKGLIRGLQFQAHGRFGRYFYADASAQYTFGRDLSNDKTLDHIPPIFGKGLLGFQKDRWAAEVWTLFNGWKCLADYSPSGEDNAAYATADGMPAWATLNARLEFQAHSTLRIQVALENILDQHYRYFASGISAPGRNLLVTLRAQF